VRASVLTPPPPLILGHACRVVLATNSYFAAMWDGDSAEAAACQASFQAADADVLRMVVQHIYGCSVEVPVQLLPEVWRLADMFQVRCFFRRSLV